MWGVEDIHEGVAPVLPYPYTVYRRRGDITSGLAGTMLQGTFIPLIPDPPPYTTRWWDEVTATFIEGTCVWNGCAAGGVQLGEEGEPHRRIYDGNLLGEWPNRPPRKDRAVNPEKAQKVAMMEALEKAMPGAYIIATEDGGIMVIPPADPGTEDE